MVNVVAGEHYSLTRACFLNGIRVIGSIDYPIKRVLTNGYKRDGCAIVVALTLESASNPAVNALGKDTIRIKLIRD